MNIDYSHIPIIGMLITDSDGNIRWNVIFGGLIGSGVVGLILLYGNVTALQATQQLMLGRIQDIEQQRIVATANRFTSQEARDMESRINYRLDKIEALLNTKKDK